MEILRFSLMFINNNDKDKILFNNNVIICYLNMFFAK